MYHMPSGSRLPRQGLIIPIWIATVMAVILFITFSCQAPASKTTDTAVGQISPAPSSPPATTPQSPSSAASSASSWKADGVISPGEYSKSKNYNDFEMHWSNDGQYIYLALKAKTAGWVAIGFGAEVMMKNADIIEGYVEGGKVTVMDMFSTGEFGPHPPDEQLGGTYDILESGGLENNGYTVIEFKRKLDTGDKFDQAVSRGINKIIWAYGSEDKATLKHLTRGPGEIDL
jgi:hypothetical protein